MRITPRAAALALLVAGPAAALVRPASTSMTCAQTAGLIRAQGAAVIGIGGQTYDRFVADAGHCEPGQATRQALRPTRDDPACLIGYTCFDPGLSKSGG